MRWQQTATLEEAEGGEDGGAARTTAAQIDLSHRHVLPDASGEEAEAGAAHVQLDQAGKGLDAEQLGEDGHGDRSLGEGVAVGEELLRAMQRRAVAQRAKEDAQRGPLRREQDRAPPARRGEAGLGFGGATPAELRAAAALRERLQAQPAKRVAASAIHVVASRATFLRDADTARGCTARWSARVSTGRGACASRGRARDGKASGRWAVGSWRQRAQ